MTQITAEQKEQIADALAKAGAGGVFIQNDEFPAPTVEEAPTGQLDPIDGRKGVKVFVQYDSMSAGDLIGLRFDTDDTFEQQWGVSSPLIFNVPVERVAAAIGRDVLVVYAVRRASGIALSTILNLKVLPIPADQLQAPQITQASGEDLDVSALTADADVTLAPWPLIAVGQMLWLKLEGSSNLDLPAWQGFKITSTGTQSTKIPLSYLQTLTNGSPLKLVVEVSFDNGVTRQPFPVKTYTVEQAPVVVAVAITSVQDSKGEVPNGGTTTDTTVTVAGTVTFA